MARKNEVLYDNQKAVIRYHEQEMVGLYSMNLCILRLLCVLHMKCFLISAHLASYVSVVALLPGQLPCSRNVIIRLRQSSSASFIKDA